MSALEISPIGKGGREQQEEELEESEDEDDDKDDMPQQEVNSGAVALMAETFVRTEIYPAGLGLEIATGASHKSRNRKQAPALVGIYRGWIGVSVASCVQCYNKISRLLHQQGSKRLIFERRQKIFCYSISNREIT